MENVAMSYDFWLSPNFYLPNSSKGAIILINFVVSTTGLEKDNVVYVIYEKKGTLYLNSTGGQQQLLRGLIQREMWNNITMVLKNGKLYPMINGVSGLDEGLPVNGGFIGGSGRLYSDTWQQPASDQNDLPLGAFELIDNFKIVQIK